MLIPWFRAWGGGVGIRLKDREGDGGHGHRYSVGDRGCGGGLEDSHVFISRHRRVRKIELPWELSISLERMFIVILFSALKILRV